MADDTDSTGSFGGFGFSGYRPSYNFTDTQSTPAPSNTENTTPGFNYGDTSGSTSSGYIPWYDQKALQDEGMFGPSLMGSDRVVQTEQNLGQVKDTGQLYGWTDDLNDYWNKYKKYVQFGIGALSRTNPALATAYGLYNLYSNPRDAVSGRVGSGMGSAVAGAINPTLAGVGGLMGSEYGQEAARAAGQGQPGARPTSSGGTDYGALGAGLGQVWNRYNTVKDYSTQGNDLASLYGQNSAYAQQLRQTLQRADAARGRRSQAGAREVELQARLADLASRNAPQLQQLTKAKSDERNKMYADLYSFGRGLRDLF